MLKKSRLRQAKISDILHINCTFLDVIPNHVLRDMTYDLVTTEAARDHKMADVNNNTPTNYDNLLKYKKLYKF